jgi:hypothetical protein
MKTRDTEEGSGTEEGEDEAGWRQMREDGGGRRRGRSGVRRNFFYHAGEFISIFGIVDGFRASSEDVDVLSGEVHNDVLGELA